MVFFLFILLNATIFIRPSEWYAPVLGWPIYQCIIVLCLVLALPAVLRQLSPENIRANPITGCVLGLLVTFALSNAIHPVRGDSPVNAYTLGKIFLYYLLLLSLLDSRKTLNRFVHWFAAIVVASAIVVILSYHGISSIAATQIKVTEYYDESAGELIAVNRVGGPGRNFDANDFAVFLVAGIVICAHLTLYTHHKLARLCWLVPLGLLGHVLWLTQSRGGVLALGASTIAWAYVTWGWRKTLWCAVPLYLTVSMVIPGGRMTNIELMGGTGQTRIQLWTTALSLLKENPILGVGPGNISEYSGGAVAHNAFLNTYAEIGFLGGTLFTGAFAVALSVLWKTRTTFVRSGDVEGQRIVTTVFATTVGFAVANLALSQQYLVSTYLVLGLAAACWQTSRRYTDRPDAHTQFDLSLLTRLSVASIVFVMAAHVFVRLMVRW